MMDESSKVSFTHADVLAVQPSHQRQALCDLAALAEESAKREQEIEKRHAKQQVGIKQTFHTARMRFDERYDRLIKRANVEYEQNLSAVTKEHVGILEQAERDFKARHEDLLEETDAAEQAIRKEREHKVWLAESLCEGRHNQADADFDKACESIDRCANDAAELKIRSTALLARFGLKQAVDDDGGDSRRDEPPGYRHATSHDCETQLDAAEQWYNHLTRMILPRLFVAWRPWAAVVGLSAIAGVAGSVVAGNRGVHGMDNIGVMAICAGVTFVVCLAMGLALKLVAMSQVRRAAEPLNECVQQTIAMLQSARLEAARLRNAHRSRADEYREAEVEQAERMLDPILQRAVEDTRGQVEEHEAAHRDHLAALQSARNQHIEIANQQHRNRIDQLERRRATFNRLTDRRSSDMLAASIDGVTRDRRNVRQRIQQSLRNLTDLAHSAKRIEPALAVASSIDQGGNEANASSGTPMIPFGKTVVDPSPFRPFLHNDESAGMEGLVAEPFDIPALVSFAEDCSVVIETGHDGRAAGLDLIRTLMARLLATLPPGRARFILFDPIGLGQSFAAFTHLGDYDESLLTGRIWSESEHINRRLADLTDHMETVIQKCLRNEFDTIEDYNAQAGELAEPYRFVVIADFPSNFNEEAARRLSSILRSGPRCGVYALILRDARHTLPMGIDAEDLHSVGAHVEYRDGKFAWKDKVMRHFPLILDKSPDESALTALAHRVGAEARNRKRVEVPFDQIAPPADQPIWPMTSKEELRIAIGKIGANKLQYFTLGRGVAQHALVAGKTGSGKSTFFHTMITNLALWYSPDELELYLIDFKKGVEFKTYATNLLPHSRAVAIESDREFGLSVLHRLDEEMRHRGDLFRTVGVQDISAYRDARPDARLPRELLVIDEFQEFFSEDDKLAQDAMLLLDRLVRQGRAFGIHAILGSQTLSGTSGLARSTIEQMAVRVALQCSETDSQMILSDTNTAARLLTRPGEAIYNDAGGLVEGNSPFQIAWLPDRHRDELLQKIRAEAAARAAAPTPATIAGEPPKERHEPIVFEGNAPADIHRNSALANLLRAKEWPTIKGPVRALLGEAIAIKDPTAAPLSRQSGGNLLIIGHRDELAMDMMGVMMLSIAGQLPPNRASFVMLDGSSAEQADHAAMRDVAEVIPHDAHFVERLDVPRAMDELTRQMHQRIDSDQHDAPAIFLFIYGLQRYRMLRRKEDSFSFSMEDEPSAPAADAQLAELLREGPAVGVHTIIWADSYTTVSRTLDRPSQEEFDYRVLFQIGAAESSQLIDSPAANRLGPFRALFFSDDLGILEKFRPYTWPGKTWVQHAAPRFVQGNVQQAT